MAGEAWQGQTRQLILSRHQFGRKKSFTRFAAAMTRGQCYKTFSVRDSHIFVLS